MEASGRRQENSKDTVWQRSNNRGDLKRSLNILCSSNYRLLDEEVDLESMKDIYQNVS